VSYMENRRSDDYQCRPQESQDHKDRKATVVKGRAYRCESRVKGHGRRSAQLRDMGMEKALSASVRAAGMRTWIGFPDLDLDRHSTCTQ